MFVDISLKSPTRRVRLFKNGRNQAVRIPRELELPGNEALLHKDMEGRLILEAVKKKDLLAVLAKLSPLSDHDVLPEIERPPAEPVEL